MHKHIPLEFVGALSKWMEANIAEEYKGKFYEIAVRAYRDGAPVNDPIWSARVKLTVDGFEDEHMAAYLEQRHARILTRMRKK